MSVTKEDLITKYSEEFLLEAQEFLTDYADYVEETESHATMAISALRGAAEAMPMSHDDI